MTLLDPEDLAYARETQAEVRPTPAELFAGINTPGGTGYVSDGMGGRITLAELGDPEPVSTPIMVRITRPTDNTSSGSVPTNLAGQYGPADLWKIKTDLVAIAVGDRIKTATTTYLVVSEGDTGSWTTAQTVWATKLDPA
jgi:hypothetical protein